MSFIINFEKAKSRIEDNKDKSEFIGIWVDYRPFRMGLWDITSLDSVYKIIQHPQFTGRLIPNASDLENGFIKTGNKIWQDMKTADSIERRELKGYIRIFKGRRVNQPAR